MNQLAADVLVDAAMRNVPQIRFFHADGADGRCAMGVLVEAYLIRHGYTYIVPFGCWNVSRLWPAIREEYDLAKNDPMEIVRRNNRGDDFLTIARKMVKVEKEKLS